MACAWVWLSSETVVALFSRPTNKFLLRRPLIMGDGRDFFLAGLFLTKELKMI